MDFIRFFINNPVKVAVGVMLLMLFGFISLITIPIQLTPNVDQPILNVTTTWTGRSPDEIEREIIEEQEDKLKNVTNLKKMTATATQGQSSIELEFFVGTKIKEARQEVSDSLREVPVYPDDVDEPVITEGEGGTSSPIAWLLLSSDDPAFDVQTLGDAVEDRVKPFLERVPGVSEVRVYGGREREVHVEFDPYKLASRGVTIDDLRQTLTAESLNISAGDISEGNYDVRIRTVAQPEELDTIRETIVRYDQGGPIRIKDVANVRLTFEKRRSFVRSKGTLALALPVYRETGANVISIMEGTSQYKGLRERVEQVNAQILPIVADEAAKAQGLASPPKLSIQQVYDETGYIYDALGLVRNNLFIGGSLAVLTLLVFLRIIRPTVIVSLAIPISVIGTFVAMTAAGRNLNVISLAGLAFAVGMVVDNAIVVIENIDRHLSMNKKPRQAAYEATKEVWGAILASTLTTLAVFIPILTIEEEAGQLFRDIALAICAAVTLSLIVSITVIPTASARFQRQRRDPKFKLFRLGRNLFGLTTLAGWVAETYSGLIHKLAAPNLFAWGVRVGIVAAFTLLSVLGSWFLMPPTDYLPRGNQNIVFGGLLTPPGFNVAHNEAIGRRIEKNLSPYWEATSRDQLKDLPPVIHPFTGMPVQNIPPLENYFFVSFNGGVFGGATSQERTNVQPVAGLLTAMWNTVPGVIGFAEQRSLFGRGLGGSRSIDVEVVGVDLADVRRSAEALLGPLRGVYSYPKVRPDPSNFDLPGPEMTVKIDKIKASALNIDSQLLGVGVRALVDGVTIGDFYLRGEAIDLVAKRDPKIEVLPDQLGSIPLAYRNRSGEAGVVPLSNVAMISRSTSPQSILRVEELRAVRLTVTPPDDTPLEDATQKIQEITAGLRKQGAVASDVEVRLEGSASKLSEVRQALLGEWHGFTLQSLVSLGLSRMFLALLVTYLLMAALFESFLYPFVIMFAVPLATVGGFMGLAITHYFMPSQQLDVLTMLGFVILIGVVVNNAILLVHQALNFMRGIGEGEGDVRDPMEPREAIRESVRTRMRPVLMTTLTSVGGMLPLVLMPGAGSELYKGLGSVVTGGLVVATMFTLLVVPLLFSVVLDVRHWFTGKWGGQER